jgi:formylglycine-generating enzyme required for sulfatase activity
MGSADGEEDERPVHRVFVSEFLIGRCPVTNEEYGRFLRATGHAPPSIIGLPLITTGGREKIFRELAAPYVWEGTRVPTGRSSHPIVLVRYHDAMAYCKWLSDVSGQPIRLPTEAEWEKAARGGVDGLRHPWGNRIDQSRAHYLTDPAAKTQEGTRPVGTCEPNAFGLYDMVGNVWEWVSDWYSADYYGLGEARDPCGPSAGDIRVVRGGSWVNADVSMLRSAYRHRVPPDTYAYSIGFRIVCGA